MEVPDFEDGSQNILKYEQYRTPSNIAADILNYIQNNEILEDSQVLELGCGTG